MTFMVLEVRDSFQHPGASAKYSHATHPAETRGRPGQVVQGITRTFSIVEAPAIEVCVIILYGKHTLAVEPELLKPRPHI